MFPTHLLVFFHYGLISGIGLFVLKARFGAKETFKTLIQWPMIV